MIQEQAAIYGGFLLNLSYLFLENRDSKMFFFFYSLAMSTFQRFNIEIVYGKQE